MEVGCNDGIKSFLLLKEGVGEVVGTDINSYYVADKSLSEVGEKDLQVVEKYLGELRTTAATTVLGGSGVPDAVKFFEDNITASGFADESFDLICSWVVLEHVLDPDSMFNEIYRLLKPGCFSFHEYNPFFSLNGGHSQGTLDFPWGHVALDEADYEEYVKRFRPREADMAMGVYHNALNRMTHADLKAKALASGLEVVAIVPWPNQEHVKALSEQTFSVAVENYPKLSVLDMVAPFVWVLLRKPKS